MRKILIFLILLLFPVCAFGAAPVLLFSDLTDGPNTGWPTADSATKGAAVSIWCRNLGASGSVIVHNVTGTHSEATITSGTAGMAEWAATTTPTVPLGMQRVTFYLTSSMNTDGTYPNSEIRVTSTDGTSGTLKFHVRAIGSNHIYIFDNAGSDAADGTVAEPKQHPYWFRANATAGDIAYFKSDGGAYTTVDGSTTAIVSLNNSRTNGTEGKSVAYVSYPGQTAQFGNSLRGYPGGTPNYGNQLVFTNPSDLMGLQYLTISKLTMIAYGYAMSLDGGGGSNGGPLRIIGNDATTSYTTMDSAYQQGTIFNLASGATKNDIFLLGNYLHNMCEDFDGDTRSDHRAYCIYLNGYGNACDRIYIGYNEMANIRHGRYTQIYGHVENDQIDNVYFFNNYFHNQLSSNDSVVFGQEGFVLAFLNNVYVYNNIIDGPSVTGSVNMLISGGDPGYTTRINFRLYNNTLYHGAAHVFFNINGTTPLIKIKNNVLYGAVENYLSYYPSTEGTVVGYLSGSDNVVYQLSNKPSWDTSSLTTNPKLTTVPPTAYTHFLLQSDSPAKEPAGTDVSSDMPAAAQLAGLNLPSVTTDFLGVTRTTYGIGAFQYGAGSTPPSAQGCTISGASFR